MSLASIVQDACFLLIVLVLVKPVGGYLARVFASERTILDPVLRPVERCIYALCGIDAQQEMNGKQYALAFVLFSTFAPKSPCLSSLILTHIFLGRPEKPITMDVFVNQSTVAHGLSRCFIKLNCKMWVKDRLLAMGHFTKS